jgi:hypothetical protein
MKKLNKIYRLFNFRIIFFKKYTNRYNRFICILKIHYKIDSKIIKWIQFPYYSYLFCMYFKKLKSHINFDIFF